MIRFRIGRDSRSSSAASRSSPEAYRMTKRPFSSRSSPAAGVGPAMKVSSRKMMIAGTAFLISWPDAFMRVFNQRAEQRQRTISRLSYPAGKVDKKRFPGIRTSRGKKGAIPPSFMKSLSNGTGGCKENSLGPPRPGRSQRISERIPCVPFASIGGIWRWEPGNVYGFGKPSIAFSARWISSSGSW